MGLGINDLLKLNSQDEQMPQGMGMMRDGPPEQAPPVDPQVKAYLTKKYGIAPGAAPVPQQAPPEDPEMSAAPAQPSAMDMYKKDFGDEGLKKAQADAQDQKSGLGWAQFAAGLGDALAGKSSAQTAQNFEGIRKGIDARTVGDFQNRKASALQDISTKKTLDSGDPNSDVSKRFKMTLKSNYPELAAKYGDQFDKLTADDQPNILKVAETKAKLEEAHDTHQMAHEDRQLKNEVFRQNMKEKGEGKTDSLNQKITAQLESARGNPAAAQAEKDLYAVKKVDSMVNLYGDPNKLNPSQVQLLASEVAKIASGGVPTHSELQGLKPSTISTGLASLAEKVTNHPSAANAGAFVKAMQDYTTSLKKDAQEVITEKYGRVIESNRKQLGEDNYGNLKKNYIDRFAQQAPKGGGKITVTNGKETLQIDPSDLAHAQADGYREQ